MRIYKLCRFSRFGCICWYADLDVYEVSHVDRTPFVSRNASFPTTIHRRQAVMTRDSVVLDDRDDMAREKMPPLVPTVLGRDVHLGLRQDSPPR